MYVHEVMKRQVRTVKKDESADLANAVLHFSNFRHLPVIDDEDHVVGMLTPRDLLDAVMKRGTTAPVPVSEVMSVPVVGIREDEDLEGAIHRMKRAEVHALPVLDREDRLVGILTDVDVLSALARDRPRGID